MGGRSSSTSTTATSTSTSSTVKDQRAVADNGALILQEGATGNTINVTDGGLVSRGLDTVDRSFDLAAWTTDLSKTLALGATSLATKANEQAGTTATAALSAVGAAYKDSGQQTNAALRAVSNAYADAQANAQGNRTLAYVGLTVAGILALGVLSNRKKT